MRERPILFNSEMIRAILENRKSQTRRVIKPQPNYMKRVGESNESMISNIAKRKCPYGKVGDKLWVRETWQVNTWNSCFIDIWYVADKKCKRYSAEYTQYYNHQLDSELSHRMYRKRPSIHMPKWAARIWLEITGIRVERVQKISEEDAKAEGIVTGSSAMGHIFTAKEHFKGLWDSLNAKRGYSWESNPFVWCIEFRNYTNERKRNEANCRKMATRQWF